MTATEPPAAKEEPKAEPKVEPPAAIIKVEEEKQPEVKQSTIT